MKRRFRQKQDIEPKNDPEKDKGLSEDAPEKNVDIDELIEEIDIQLKAVPDDPGKE
ncbi:MAG: hypothetical protein MZU84_07640 [Sphingobacterium sp.]|nr:hypothetical protein [Sphingobacterium sp.]